MANALSSFIALENVQHDNNSEILDDEDDVIIFAAVSCFMRRKLNRVNGFFEDTIPLYLTSEFKNHFRMTRGTFDMFLQEMMHEEQLNVHNPCGRPTIPPEKQLLIFLWTMANKEPNRAIADRFDVTISSAHRTLRRITEAVIALCPRYIKWPNGECSWKNAQVWSFCISSKIYFIS